MTKWDAMRAWLERSRNAGGLERGHGADAGGNYCVGSGMTPNAAQPHFTKRKETTMELLKNYTDAQVLTLADTPTPPPMAGIWTLTAPDGQTWTAESPMRCASVEMAGRVAPLVALARIRRNLMDNGDDVAVRALEQEVAELRADALGEPRHGPGASEEMNGMEPTPGMTKHIFEQHEDCYIQHCAICVGGLSICTVCRLAEGALTTDCPGAPTSFTELVYEGKLDYREGEWVEACSPHSPAFRDKPEVKD